MDERGCGGNRTSKGRSKCGGRDETRSHRDSDRVSETESESRREARHARRASRRDDRHGREQRVLHTRISERLSDDIRRLAEDLRVPTSNLVRNVLEEVFSVVESVSDDVSDLVDDVLEEAPRRMREMSPKSYSTTSATLRKTRHKKTIHASLRFHAMSSNSTSSRLGDHATDASLW